MSMSETDRPISALQGQGWDIAHYTATTDVSTGMQQHCFVMRKGKDTKVVMVRKKIMGDGVMVEEMVV